MELELQELADPLEDGHQALVLLAVPEPVFAEQNAAEAADADPTAG